MPNHQFESRGIFAVNNQGVSNYVEDLVEEHHLAKRPYRNNLLKQI